MSEELPIWTILDGINGVLNNVQERRFSRFQAVLESMETLFRSKRFR
jgi:hypothetical protein